MTTRTLALTVALLWGSLESYAVSPSIDPFNFIVPGADWRYWDKTEYPGDAWRTLAFDDSSWSQGAAPLGFGDLNGIVPTTLIANNRQTTSFFRRTFVVANPARFNQLALSLLRDDGAVVWLNGAELLSPGMGHVRRAYEDYLRGEPSRDPAVLAMTFSAIDPDVAPPDKHPTKESNIGGP